MDIRSLRFAVTLAEELHFGRAASAHYIGAQPFGQRIQQLERQLGVRLFERTTRKVVLTNAGLTFVPRARRILSEIDGLMHTTSDTGIEGTLRIGVLGFGLADLWPLTRSMLIERCPELNIVYVELDWANQYDALRTGEVDIAVLHDVGGADELIVEQVMEVDRYAVVPVGSDLADADALRMADIAELPMVTPVGQPGLTSWVGANAAYSGITVRSPGNIPTAVATTGAVGIYGEPARRYFPHPGVRYLPLEGQGGTIAIGSRPRDERHLVTCFREVVSASKATHQLLNRAGFDAASVSVKDADHAQALPTRAT